MRIETIAQSDNVRYCARCEAEMDKKDWFKYPECQSCVDAEIEKERCLENKRENVQRL